MASADGSNISDRGMGMPFGSPNRMMLRLYLCHIPLCVGADQTVLEYCRFQEQRRLQRVSRHLAAGRTFFATFCRFYLAGNFATAHALNPVEMGHFQKSAEIRDMSASAS
jgi:hypothetical protein